MMRFWATVTGASLDDTKVSSWQLPERNSAQEALSSANNFCHRWNIDPVSVEIKAT